MASASSDHQRRLDELHEKFASLGLRGYWQNRREQYRVQPRLWRWQDVYPALMQAADVVRIGPEAFRRNMMTCHVQMLLPRETTRPHRHTGTTHYHVVQGNGITVVGRDEPIELEWTAHDSFTLPPWRWHQYRNESATEPAILFSVTDRPLLEMTGLDREERG